MAEDSRIPCTVFINNIDTSVSEELLRTTMGTVGKLLQFRLHGDPELPSRWGFFEYEDQATANKAKRLLQGTKVGRYTINVKAANSSITGSSAPAQDDGVTKTVYVGGLGPEVGDEDVRSFFSERCGPVKRVSLSGTDPTYRYAFVEFNDRGAFSLALNLNGSILCNSLIKVSLSKVGQGGGVAKAAVPAVTPATPVSPVPLLGNISMEAFQEQQQRCLQLLTSQAAQTAAGQSSIILELPTVLTAKPKKEKKAKKRSRSRSRSRRRSRSRSPARSHKRRRSRSRSRSRGRSSRKRSRGRS
eukprot:EG_transcript_16664